jgi:YbbR domain-containing protein
VARPASSTAPRLPVLRLKSSRFAELRRHYSLERLRNSFRHNLGLRIISLLLAVGLWLFVNTGQHSSLASFNVPIGYRGLPIGFVMTNQHPDFVKVQLSGPRTLLSLVDPSRLALRLDLNGVGVGQASFKIGPDAFNVPRGTSVTSISPSQIILDIDKIITHYLPIHLVSTGKVADGYRIASIEFTPSTVRVRAPSKQLARIEAVDTEAVDLTGLSTDVTRQVALASPGEMSRVEPTQVTVKISLSQEITSRDFHGVPVEVRDTDYQSKVAPERINLTVRGPKRTLAKLVLKGAVYVDADGLEPGSHDAAVQVQLPQGVELLRQWPEKVRIRIRRAISG